MDHSAIERIEELTSAANSAPNTDIQTAVLPGGARLESLEPFRLQPYMMRNTFSTERLDDFCAYVEAEKFEQDTALFVRPDGGGAEAVIDYGSHKHPKWGKHRAKLAMKHTPEFAALARICNTGDHQVGPLSQRTLTDWLEDWNGIVSPVDADDNSMPLARAIAAIRRVQIKASATADHEDGDFNKKRSSMEEIEAKSGNGNLPAQFRVMCRVYPDLEMRAVAARLSLRTGASEPHFALRIIGYERLMDEVAHEVEDKIKAACTGTRIFIGSV